MGLSDISVPLVEVLFWTLGGMVLGAFLGWQLRIAYEAREAARETARKLDEVEVILENDKNWDGHDRRKPEMPHQHRKDDGRVSLNTLFITSLIVLAVVSSLLGIFTAFRVQQQTECYTQVNERFAQTIEIRNVEAGELNRQAADLDRQALDALIAQIITNVEFEATSEQEADILPALNDYRQKRQEADSLRSQASQFLEDNPYPTADVCR